MKWLDAGALGLILPMIDERATETSTVCLLLSPAGNRSHGPRELHL